MAKAKRSPVKPGTKRRPAKPGKAERLAAERAPVPLVGTGETMVKLGDVVELVAMTEYLGDEPFFAFIHNEGEYEEFVQAMLALVPIVAKIWDRKEAAQNDSGENQSSANSR